MVFIVDKLLLDDIFHVANQQMNKVLLVVSWKNYHLLRLFTQTMIESQYLLNFIDRSYETTVINF